LPISFSYKRAVVFSSLSQSLLQMLPRSHKPVGFSQTAENRVFTAFSRHEGVVLPARNFIVGNAMG
jgi:hypothetical protein